eukprot:NP_508577.2 Uncharacterized protein CELE_ZK816.3 [Caenorhabditis elegans]
MTLRPILYRLGVLRPDENVNNVLNASQQRPLPFFFRLFIGPHIARYLRMRRLMNEARRQNLMAHRRQDNANTSSNSSVVQRSSVSETY